MLQLKHVRNVTACDDQGTMPWVAISLYRYVLPRIPNFPHEMGKSLEQTIVSKPDSARLSSCTYHQGEPENLIPHTPRYESIDCQLPVLSSTHFQNHPHPHKGSQKSRRPQQNRLLASPRFRTSTVPELTSPRWQS